MIAYKGRLSFKLYMPQKPTKHGMKVRVCADSETGYVLNHEVYLGKDKDGDAPQEQGLGYYVVMNMTSPYHGGNRHVYFDNFFTSPKLMEDLLESKTYACGTVRTNRKGLPKSAKAKLKKGEISLTQKGKTPLILAKWQDKRDINVLSTNCCPTEPPEKLLRRTKTGEQTEIQKPKAICNYNRNMFGVDLSDQYRSYYPLGRKGHKWYKYGFWFILDIMISNAFILEKKKHPEQEQKRT